MIPCSKSTIKTTECQNVWNLFKANKKEVRMISVDIVLLLLTWNISDTLFCF